jgi:phenylacetic acid degradation operon negative regulatory protein
MREAQPKARILDLFGAFGRRGDGWLAIADIIALLREFDIDAAAIRSACSRMKAGDLLVSERRDATAGYRLSEEAETILADGDRRIFADADTEGDGWVLCIFSVPEDQRSDRYLIRSRLAWLGFGQAAPGVFVAPSHRAAEARRMLERLGLMHHVTMWEAELLDGGGDPRDLVARAWDLDAVRDTYQQYIEAFQPVLDAWRANGADDRQAFLDYLESLSHWRRLPYLDPGLPEHLTPHDWPARHARHLFTELQATLEDAAHAHFKAVTG